MKSRASKIAAVIYILWGLLHVTGGAVLLNASLSGFGEFAEALASKPETPSINYSGENNITKWVFAFHSFNIMWIGLLTILIAVFLNWKNSPSGYWINIALTGFADLGLIFFMVIPDVMSISEAWIGPVLFVLSVLFSTIGRLQIRNERLAMNF